MSNIMDKVQIAEMIAQYLMQNDDALINTAQDYLGLDIEINRKDRDSVIVVDGSEDLDNELIGAFNYA